MAIDTAAERWSVIGIGFGAPPLPDASIDADDRFTFMGIYNPDAAAVAAAAKGVAISKASTSTHMSLGINL